MILSFTRYNHVFSSTGTNSRLGKAHKKGIFTNFKLKKAKNI